MHADDLSAAYRSLTALDGPRVQSAPMSIDERSTSRAEARRRARLAARGELAEPAESEPIAAPEGRRPGGFLGRIFPSAPPLPNRPDPLAGYRGGQPRIITERLHLLRVNPLSWLATGLVAFVGVYVSISYQQSTVGLIGTFVLFGALIAAGWFGWQRPGLYGTSAAIIGYLGFVAVVLYSFASRGVGPDTFGGPTQAISGLGLQGVYYAGLGFVGGWYGGYLRRRQAQVSAELRPRRRR